MFIELFIKLLPLYVTIFLGFVSGRKLGLSGNHIAGTMLYIITPIIVFSGVMSASLSPSTLILPFVVWMIGIAISFLFLNIGQRRWADSRANILALTVGTGNTGYFGIPVAYMLFGEDALGLYILCMLGTTLHENSVGFYLAAKGAYPARECLLRVFRLPSLYAFLLAVVLNLAGAHIPEVMMPLVEQMRGAYTILGMMIIGVGIAGLRATFSGLDFTGLAFAGKFIVWPSVIAVFIVVDRACWQLFDTLIYQCLFLVAVTPVAANTVVIANLLNVHPRQVSSTTLLSTFVALFYIPWIMGLGLFV